ncbi:MAG TPA: DUF2760 domain-containing protein [Candidatus Eisenbacteria bacterium]|nr:DUF2760 domain-containing protein [Candidatus Eisenbacteria bacterium]
MKTYGVALVLGLALAGGNYAVLGQRPEVAGCAPCLALLLAGPLVLALAVAAVAGTGASASGTASAVAVPSTKPAEPAENAALRLLATLQEEGRLVDFFSEDIAPYTDEQIGAATRGIHASCRKALEGAVAIEPIMPGDEGATVTVPAGFDPAAIRLVGNVSGTPPFTGVLRHAGWRVKSVNLPPRTGQDPKVVAPAEVEIG